MKYNCNVIKDLLPLYYDSFCSDESKKMVEGHLAECDGCKELFKKMNDRSYDNHLQDEKNKIISQYRQKTKTRIGQVILGLCAAALIICFIVNLATAHTLSWFFIVLMSLGVFSSLTAVPLIVPRKKFLWTFCSFTASLILLLLTCCIYSGGNWFFVAGVSVIFGLCVVFLPIVMAQLPLKGFAKRNKGLFVMLTDSALLFLLITVCGFYTTSTNYWYNAFSITAVCSAFAWILFLAIRYLKVNGFIKAGISLVISGVFVAVISDFITFIYDGVWQLTLLSANLLDWSNYAVINGNIYLLSLLLGGIIGLSLLVTGLIKRKK